MSDVRATRDGRDAVLASEPGSALAALVAAFQHVTIGMVVRGPDCRLLDVNLAYSRMLSYERDGLLVLDSASARPVDQAIGMTWWRRLAAGEVDTHQREKRYLRKDGSVLWGLATVSALRDERGGFAVGLAQVQVITAQKVVGLVRLDQSKTQFLSTISHEFRTPLTKTVTRDDARTCKRVAHPGNPLSPHHSVTLGTFVGLQVVHQILLQRLDIDDVDQAFAEVLAQVDTRLRFRDRAHARRDGNRIDQCSLAKLRRQRPQTDLIDRQLRREVRYAPRQRLRPFLLVVTVPVQVGRIAPGGKPLHAAPSSSPARV